MSRFSIKQQKVIMIHNGEKRLEFECIYIAAIILLYYSRTYILQVLQQLSDGEVQKKWLAHIYVVSRVKSCVPKQSVWSTISLLQKMVLCAVQVGMEILILKFKSWYMVDRTCISKANSSDQNQLNICWICVRNKYTPL